MVVSLPNHLFPLVVLKLDCPPPGSCGGTIRNNCDPDAQAAATARCVRPAAQGDPSSEAQQATEGPPRTGWAHQGRELPLRAGRLRRARRTHRRGSRAQLHPPGKGHAGEQELKGCGVKGPFRDRLTHLQVKLSTLFPKSYVKRMKFSLVKINPETYIYLFVQFGCAI